GLVAATLSSLYLADCSVGIFPCRSSATEMVGIVYTFRRVAWSWVPAIAAYLGCRSSAHTAFAGRKRNNHHIWQSEHAADFWLFISRLYSLEYHFNLLGNQHRIRRGSVRQLCQCTLDGDRDDRISSDTEQTTIGLVFYCAGIVLDRV